MANNELNQLNLLFNRLLKRVNSTTVKKLVGITAKQMIYNRVKTGYGVESEGKPPERTRQKRLSPLSQSYINYRKGKIAFYKGRHGKVYATTNKKYIRKPKLGRFGSPNRSNLTLSGKMLEALTYESRGNSIVIKVKNTRHGNDSFTNAELARWNSEGTTRTINGKRVVIPKRPWLALTNVEWRILETKIRNIISKEVQKIFS